MLILYIYLFIHLFGWCFYTVQITSEVEYCPHIAIGDVMLQFKLLSYTRISIFLE